MGGGGSHNNNPIKSNRRRTASASVADGRGGGTVSLLDVGISAEPPWKSPAVMALSSRMRGGGGNGVGSGSRSQQRQLLSSSARTQNGDRQSTPSRQLSSSTVGEVGEVVLPMVVEGSVLNTLSLTPIRTVLLVVPFAVKSIEDPDGVAHPPSFISNRSQCR